MDAKNTLSEMLHW